MIFITVFLWYSFEMLEWRPREMLGKFYPNVWQEAQTSNDRYILIDLSLISKWISKKKTSFIRRERERTPPASSSAPVPVNASLRAPSATWFCIYETPGCLRLRPAGLKGVSEQITRWSDWSMLLFYHTMHIGGGICPLVYIQKEMCDSSPILTSTDSTDFMGINIVL